MHIDPLEGAKITAESQWGSNRYVARSLLIKSRLYRFFALSFALMGVVIFLFLYFKHVEGQLFEALRDPTIIAIVLFPFLPAIVLSLMAQGLERKFKKLGKGPETPTTPPAKKK